MDDSELIQLQQEKQRLLREVQDMTNRLKNKEENEDGPESVKQLIQDLDIENLPKVNIQLKEKFNSDVLNISSRLSGITLQDCNKKLLDDGNDCFTAVATTKSIKFYLEVTVYKKDETEIEIKNVMCHFIHIKECVLLEIQPWIQKIAKLRDLSLLFSAASEYNEKNLMRSKVLHAVEREKYATIEECENDKGGIIAYLHSPEDANQVYLKLHWIMTFSDWNLQIVNFFVINATENGKDFARINQSLLKRFCATNINKNQLTELWNDLITAINDYETPEHEQVTSK